MRRAAKRSRLGAAVMAMVFLMTSETPSASQAQSGAVAKLGESEFDAQALLPFVQSLDPALRKQALANPELMNRLVGMELARIAVLKEALVHKWRERPEVARRIERAKDDAIFSSYIAAMAALPKDYPSDAEVAAAYEKNRDLFMNARQYRLEQIFIALAANAPAKAVAAAEAKAQEIARIARAKIVDFPALAKTRSEHKASAEKGGDLGWATEAQIVEQIRVVVPGMELGDISDPIRTNAGLHIVRLAETRSAGPRPLAEVKDQLVLMLRQKRLEANQQAYIAKLVTKTPVAVNQERLKKLFETAP